MMQNSIIRNCWRLFALGLVVLLSACSLGRLGYNNADTITYWWLNGYVDFDPSQGHWARQRVDALYAWHRQTQLKTYVPILTNAQHLLERNVSKADVMAEYDDIGKALDRVIERAAPDLADLAIAMNGENMDALKQKFDATNRKFRKDYLDGDREQRQEHRYKLVMEWAEYWFGDFSDEQETAIRRASDTRPLNNEFWVEDRTMRQHALIAMLERIHREKLSHDAATVLIRNYIANNFLERKDAPPEMQAFFAASKDGLAQLSVTIVNLTTPKQRAHAKEKMQQWIDDFNTLAANN
jgi:hypothetical protein